jgi:hypothetical protein
MGTDNRRKPGHTQNSDSPDGAAWQETSEGEGPTPTTRSLPFLMPLPRTAC